MLTQTLSVSLCGVFICQQRLLQKSLKKIRFFFQTALLFLSLLAPDSQNIMGSFLSSLWKVGHLIPACSPQMLLIHSWLNASALSSPPLPSQEFENTQNCPPSFNHFDFFPSLHSFIRPTFPNLPPQRYLCVLFLPFQFFNAYLIVLYIIVSLLK